MREMIKMVVVLTILSTFSGGLLAAIYSKTEEQVKIQELKYAQGPAIHEIFKGASNDPIVDRFTLKDGDIERSIFVGIFDGKADKAAFEAFGKGYGGKLGVMVGVDVTEDKIVGAGVTTHLETPGVGARAKTEPTFVSQFKGLKITDSFKIKADGGQVDALSGATYTSRGISAAMTDAGKIYERLKPQIEEKLKSFTN